MNPATGTRLKGTVKAILICICLLAAAGNFQCKRMETTTTKPTAYDYSVESALMALNIADSWQQGIVVSEATGDALYASGGYQTYICGERADWPAPGKLVAPSPDTETYWRHFSYLIQLKNDIAAASWPDYAQEDVSLPTLYYTMEGTFVINPNPHILQLTNPEPVPSPDPDWKIYRLPESYTDTTEFQFSNSYSDDPNDLYYKENIMVFSSFELTQRFVPITDLDEWAEMVLHELFHSYQRSIPEFREYYINLPIPGGPDAFLGAYHKELPWYRELVEQENQVLKDVWQGASEPSTGIQTYYELREKRRKRILEEYGVDISEIEDYEILIEGHARYFQSLAKRYMRDHPTDTSMLDDVDRELIGNIFEGYEPAWDTGLSDIYNDRYYYQLGYNISMILEQYLPAYGRTIYIKEFNFNSYLEQLRTGEAAGGRD